MKVLARLREMKSIVDDLAARFQGVSSPDPDDIRHFTTLSQFLTDAQHASAEYAAMARAFLR